MWFLPNNIDRAAACMWVNSDRKCEVPISRSPTIEGVGANTPGTALVKQEEGSDKVTHLSERPAVFDLPTHLCPCTALKWSQAWWSGRWG